jgi:hypothetical protein
MRRLLCRAMAVASCALACVSCDEPTSSDRALHAELSRLTTGKAMRCLPADTSGIVSTDVICELPGQTRVFATYSRGGRLVRVVAKWPIINANTTQYDSLTTAESRRLGHEPRRCVAENHAQIAIWTTADLTFWATFEPMDSVTTLIIRRRAEMSDRCP